MVRPLPLDNPQNPWASQHVEYLGEAPTAQLTLLEDQSRRILSENDSPDLPFRYSVNPYRGCLHACAYCYARPSHEYLGLGAGTDFDRRIVVKRRAPELLTEAFEAPSWRGEMVLFSGNTDCYQPIEATLELTRRCLQVCLAYRNPVHVITKGALIERDLDVLCALSKETSLGVTLSIPFWNPEHARALEPGAPTPQRRVETVRRLTEAGLSVTVNIGPVIPGLADNQIPDILSACAAAGAKRAALIMLRLPGPVKEVFEQRLRRELPLSAEKVLKRTREARGGKLNDPRFGARMRGQGEYYAALEALFLSTARRLGLESGCGSLQGDSAPSTFRRPTDRHGQLRLFG